MHEFRKKIREKEEILLALQENQTKKHNQKYPKKNSFNIDNHVSPYIIKTFNANIEQEINKYKHISNYLIKKFIFFKK